MPHELDRVLTGTTGIWGIAAEGWEDCAAPCLRCWPRCRSWRAPTTTASGQRQACSSEPSRPPRARARAPARPVRRRRPAGTRLARVQGACTCARASPACIGPHSRGPVRAGPATPRRACVATCRAPLQSATSERARCAIYRQTPLARARCLCPRASLLLLLLLLLLRSPARGPKVLNCRPTYPRRRAASLGPTGGWRGTSRSAGRTGCATTSCLSSRAWT
jgi:hypothetical protein